MNASDDSLLYFGNGSQNFTGPCVTIQDAYPDIVDRTWIRVLFGLLYAVIMLLGLTGNLLVIYVAGYRKLSFTVRTVFILSLASSDLLITSASLPLTGIMIFSREWVFPGLVCYPTNFIQCLACIVSSLTLVAIAIDRFFLIIYPTRNIIDYRRALVCLFCIWILGFLTALPFGLHTQVSDFDGFCGIFCEEVWDDPRDRKTFGYLILLIQYSIPILVCSVSYLRIAKRLREQMEARQSHQLLPEAEKRLMERTNRTNRMMVAMVALFLLSWLPLTLTNISNDLALNLISDAMYNIVFACGHVCAMTQVIWNPIIYSWFNKSFRKAVFTKIGICRQAHSRAVSFKSKVHKNGTLLTTARDNFEDSRMNASVLNLTTLNNKLSSFRNSQNSLSKQNGNCNGDSASALSP